MKKNAFLGILAILLVFGFVGCMTFNPMDITFTPSEVFDDPGIILAGDIVGHFDYIGPTYGIEMTFLPARGDRGIDNDSFEVRNDNTLIAKRNLFPKEYNIRIRMLDVRNPESLRNDESYRGLTQNVFTFTVTKALEFPQEFQGSWFKEGDRFGLIGSTKLVIEGYNLNTVNTSVIGTSNNYDFIFVGKSEDIYTLESSHVSETVQIDLVNGNLVLSNSSNATYGWNGVYVRQ